MILKQVFLTAEGAAKRARFENAHCDNRWLYIPIRFYKDRRDDEPFDRGRWTDYTWRLYREGKGFKHVETTD